MSNGQVRIVRLDRFDERAGVFGFLNVYADLANSWAHAQPAVVCAQAGPVVPASSSVERPLGSLRSIVAARAATALCTRGCHLCVICASVARLLSPWLGASLHSRGKAAIHFLRSAKQARKRYA